MMEFKEFWNVFTQEYLPNKISDDWLESNEEFIEESVHSIYRFYQKSDIEYGILMNILSEILINAYTSFREHSMFD